MPTIIRNLLFSSAFLIDFSAHASLVDRGNGMIYDTDLDITWLQDANYAFTSGYDVDGIMNWQEALTWAEQLTFGGYDDWRLPRQLATATEPYCDLLGCLDTEYAYMYYINLNGSPGDRNLNRTGDRLPFVNIAHQYWSAQEIDAVRSMNFHFSDGLQFIHFNTEYFNTWAVRDGDVLTTPLPSAAWLFISGLLGLLGSAKKFDFGKSK